MTYDVHVREIGGRMKVGVRRMVDGRRIVDVRKIVGVRKMAGGKILCDGQRPLAAVESHLQSPFVSLSRVHLTQQTQILNQANN